VEAAVAVKEQTVTVSIADVALSTVTKPNVGT